GIGIDVTLVIPGYLVILSLLYAGFGTWIILRLSRPLVALNYHMEKSEADLRFGLIRLRESAEQVALLRGEAQENRRLRDRLAQLIEITYAVAKRRKLMIVLTSGYSQISSIFPLMVIAPRFFAKSVSLGGMMQTVGAFNQVQDALSYLVDNYNEFAEFQAVTLRLTGFENAILHPATLPHSEKPGAQVEKPRAELQRLVSAKPEIIIENLHIYTPQNQPILPPITLKIAAEEWVMLSGRSGLGKSSLLRTVAGIWPYASGSITSLPVSGLFFMPQKPYLPIGSLAACLTYPLPPESVERNTLVLILEECGLATWRDKLEQEQNWATCLSQGEAQMIGFARLLCAKPRVALLDEATSSLDIDREASFYAMVRRNFPNLTLLSVAHRTSLNDFHDRIVVLDGDMTRQGGP
ncbi:MAG: ATP-binding cassette domain-containing protein, partial [Alphaproteobacteria bacterium]|nr:ATP-binding cassette domain-containing protein [Alphaproteobacteria bacterium]